MAIITQPILFAISCLFLLVHVQMEIQLRRKETIWPKLTNRRQCSGLLRGKNDKLYQIWNPSEGNPSCLRLIDSNTGMLINEGGL